MYFSSSPSVKFQDLLWPNNKKKFALPWSHQALQMDAAASQLPLKDFLSVVAGSDVLQTALTQVTANDKDICVDAAAEWATGSTSSQFSVRGAQPLNHPVVFVIPARWNKDRPEVLNALPFVSGYEANEDKVHTEPLPADPDEPPPPPVMLADAVPAAPVAPVSLDCSKMAYTEYTEPGQLTRTGSSPRLNLNICLDSILLLSSL